MSWNSTILTLEVLSMFREMERVELESDRAVQWEINGHLWAAERYEKVLERAREARRIRYQTDPEFRRRCDERTARRAARKAAMKLSQREFRCKHCGEQYDPRARVQGQRRRYPLYCSSLCRRRSRYQRDKERSGRGTFVDRRRKENRDHRSQELTCTLCGRVFTRQFRAGPVPRFCSEACVNEGYRRPETRRTPRARAVLNPNLRTPAQRHAAISDALKTYHQRRKEKRDALIAEANAAHQERKRGASASADRAQSRRSASTGGTR